MDSGRHDLDRVLEGLWQCLANDKRPLGLVLGAGCPVSIPAPSDGAPAPLIPDIAGLTAAINTLLSTSNLKDDHSILLAELVADLGREPNVEEILSRLRTLALVAGAQKVRNLSKSSIEALERAVTAAIADLVNAQLPEADTPYDTIATWVKSAVRSAPFECSRRITISLSRWPSKGTAPRTSMDLLERGSRFSILRQ